MLAPAKASDGFCRARRGHDEFLVASEPIFPSHRMPFHMALTSLHSILASFSV